MSEYAIAAGTVQKFGEKPVVESREVGDQVVRKFTIKSITSGKLVGINVWPEFDLPEIVRGAFVVADGKFEVRPGNNGQDWINLTPTSLVVTSPVPRSEREGGPAKTAATTTGSPF